jgi:hypothetical protein
MVLFSRYDALLAFMYDALMSWLMTQSHWTGRLVLAGIMPCYASQDANLRKWLGYESL